MDNSVDLLISKRRKAQSIIADIARSAFPLLRVKRKMFDILRHDFLCQEKIEEDLNHPEFIKDAKLFAVIKKIIKEEHNPEKAIKALKKISIPNEWKQDFNKMNTQNVSYMRDLV